jgi:thiamine pyrophosphate-dependent acetolactate synthase large subunit-like protein
MNGAESVIHLAREAGVEVCFANPGTTEMPLVVALDAVPGVRAILADRRSHSSTSARASPTGSPTCTTRAAPGRRW